MDKKFSLLILKLSLIELVSIMAHLWEAEQVSCGLVGCAMSIFAKTQGKVITLGKRNGHDCATSDESS